MTYVPNGWTDCSLLRYTHKHYNHLHSQHHQLMLTSLAIITILAQHLRSHIVRSTAGGVQQLRTRSTVTVGITNVQCTETKVRDLQVAVGVQKKILQ